MPRVVLGLDIGGANLKAATPDKRAVSVPFALWKQPDRLPAALAELVGQFPDAEELAVTMTGELCDCFETKLDGVNAILTAVLNVSRSRPVWVWSTDGKFLNTEEARRDHLKVAAANWHALGTLAGQYSPHGLIMLVDVGSTTTDIIPIIDGTPAATGRTDPERLASEELVYVGVRRTPVCAIAGPGVAAELFATTHDVYLLLGKASPDPGDTETADGRPATCEMAHARLARMKCSDPALMSVEQATDFAAEIHNRILARLDSAYRRVIGGEAVGRLSPQQRVVSRFVLSGSGEFLAREFLRTLRADNQPVISLTDKLGDRVASCAPAYAVAVLAAEGRHQDGGRITRGWWPWSRS
ncbi:MAG: H4MPT-linked transfer pathway protein [Gemmataceae bacterium]|nr:H4MPT-linked transfer pathway protein [Gemmataceae bacterium]